MVDERLYYDRQVRLNITTIGVASTTHTCRMLDLDRRHRAATNRAGAVMQQCHRSRPGRYC